MLFTIFLYSIYRENPESLRINYDALLAATGLADAPTLAKNFGLDITAIAFWRGGLNVLRGQINEFEQMVK